MKNKKKVVILSLMLILIQISILTSTVMAEVIEGSSNEISWSYDSETKKLTFSGSGEINNNWKSTVNSDDVTAVEILNGVTSIGNNAFYYCRNLTSVEIPTSVNRIGDEAFSDCRNLADIELPNGLTTIGDKAFVSCVSLTDIEIPASVTSIGTNVFAFCTGLTRIDVANDNPNYASEGGVLYNKDKTVLKYYPASKEETSYKIPDGVTGISRLAFYSSTNLTSIEIPNSVTNIDEGAFSCCTALTNMEIPSSITRMENGIFYKCAGLKNVQIPNTVTSIGEVAFSECTGLTSIKIPDSVENIEAGAFYECTGLTSMEIPNGATNLGEAIFQGCTGLTSIEIPNSVTSLGERAFYECTGLTKIAIPSSVTNIGEGAFLNCQELTIYCQTESKAYQYAQANDISYIIDDTQPTITQLIQKGAYVEITATDNENGVGLSNAPYSKDGEHWQKDNNIAVETTKEYDIYVKDALGNVTTRKINVDMDKPIISKIETDGKKIIITAKDEISGLAEKAYSIDGNNWQESSTIEVSNEGTYTVFVRDAMGNIQSEDVTIGDNGTVPTNSQEKAEDNSGSSKNKDAQKATADSTVTPNIFGQYGSTKVIVWIVAVIGIFGIIAKKKHMNSNYKA